MRLTRLSTFILLTFLLAYPVLAQHDFRVVEGMKVMLAVTGVEEIKKHPEEHPEAKMHAGAGDTHHLLIHIEDEKTGKIIGDASVMVTLHRPDGTKASRHLEPMTINKRTNFGGYFDLSKMGAYHIEVTVTPKEGTPRAVFFIHSSP